MSRVLIFGNSGSGKSWLASELSDVKTTHIALDDIFWMSGGYNRKRPKVEVLEKIQSIKSLPDWVVEGVYGKILIGLIGKADSVIFLDFCWKDCEKALLSRGSESSQQINIKGAEKTSEISLCGLQITTQGILKILIDSIKSFMSNLTGKNTSYLVGMMLTSFFSRKNANGRFSSAVICDSNVARPTWHFSLRLKASLPITHRLAINRFKIRFLYLARGIYQ